MKADCVCLYDKMEKPLQNEDLLPALYTKRLVLHKLQEEDAEAIYRLRSDPEVNAYLNRPLCNNIAEAREFIGRINNRGAGQINYYWGIYHRDSNVLAGTICLWGFSVDGRKAETGFELLPLYMHKGYMQEALHAVLAFGFGVLGLSTVEGWAHKDNVHSIRLMQRMQFHFAGPAPKEDEKDMVIYTLGANQFRAG